MTTDSDYLQEIASAIATLAGIADEHVALTENAEGTFTLSVLGVLRTGGLVKLLAWGFAEARLIAKQIADSSTRPRPR